MSGRSQGEGAERIEQAATEWFFLRDGGFTPEQSRAFAQWLKEDRRHRAAFEEIEHTWSRLAEARPLVQPDAAVSTPRSHSLRFVRWLPVGLAAAAAIALVGWFGRASLRERADFAEQAATEVGGLRRLDLPDGSFVTLNTNSSVDVQFTAAKRRLDYADAPLSEIIADFNRYNQHKLVVTDARLAERRFGGTFPAGDYASLVQLLEKTFGVVVERRERETVLRLP
jgi:ferric-dicitrate binding protein FerR (iron transport regulator)